MRSFLDQYPEVTASEFEELKAKLFSGENSLFFDEERELGEEENKWENKQVRSTERLKDMFLQTEELRAEIKEVELKLQKMDKRVPSRNDEGKDMNENQSTNEENKRVYYIKKGDDKAEKGIQEPNYQKKININQIYKEGHSQERKIGFIRSSGVKLKFFKLNM